MNHDPASLAASGFRPLGDAQSDMPGPGRIRRVAIDHDLAVEGVTAFRIAEGLWQCYARPDAAAGFVDRPMLPSAEVAA